MALTSVQKGIAEETAHLLAESLLDEEIKKTIIDGMDKLPEHLIFRIRDALRAERDELQRVTFEINLFLKDQNDDWQKLEENQQQAAESIVNKYAQKIEDQIKLKQVRDSLDK